MDGFIRRCSELVADTMQELVNKQKKYLEKENFAEFYAKDNRFHQLIFETAGEALAWKTIEDVGSHYDRVRLLYGKINGVGSIINEHERMVAAARKRNAEAMRKAVMEYSNNLLEQAKSMSKQYPQFFTNDFKQQ